MRALKNYSLFTKWLISVLIKKLRFGKCNRKCERWEF